ncbi:hypothetical protein [Brevifollis gellanilyticus]|uniref:Uncharacterized protein n=1 Tax=Brevifollis gellanilyticus TaxID=748831 RepID=A0A512M936_9BACT|nr:hypothetical protein [Brevifollis gellanilyticus]GEP43235.1 hypothetical protein BGE01nite_25260 [Brevifollis gellanilyticus]
MSSIAIKQNTSFQQLQDFMQANAGKDIRAKTDDKGEVTLYARSNWKPSVRYFSQKGDMSGRTAKQDLARATVSKFMTDRGIPANMAKELMSSCKPGELHATSTTSTGIWIKGSGFTFPGMQGHTGLDQVLSQADKYAQLKAKPFTEQLKDPELGPKIRDGCKKAYCPELSNCLDGLNELGKDGARCSDRELRNFVGRFMNGGQESVNDDLMGPNTETTGIKGFKNDMAKWEAMPPGQERDAAKQKLLDELQTTLAKGVDSMIRGDVVRRMPDY